MSWRGPQRCGLWIPGTLRQGCMQLMWPSAPAACVLPGQGHRGERQWQSRQGHRQGLCGERQWPCCSACRQNQGVGSCQAASCGGAQPCQGSRERPPPAMQLPPVLQPTHLHKLCQSLKCCLPPRRCRQRSSPHGTRSKSSSPSQLGFETKSSSTEVASMRSSQPSRRRLPI